MLTHHFSKCAMACFYWLVGHSVSSTPDLLSVMPIFYSGRGWWTGECRGELRIYSQEHQWRRRLTGPVLTLRCESVGSKQDRYPGSPRRKRWMLAVGGFTRQWRS